MGQSAATTPGAKSGSVFNQSAQGLGNAGKATLAAGQGFAGLANDPTGGLGANASQGYNAAQMGGNFGYNAANMNAAQSQAAMRGSTGYEAAMQAGPGTIQSGMATYMNPYTKDVIGNTQRDIQRQTQMGLGAIGDQAAGMGAFGGSRQGIAEGTAIGEGSRALGDISAQMRQQGFDTAAQLSGQDINNRMNVNAANQAVLNAQRQYGANSREAMMAANQAATNANNQFNAGNQQAAWANNQAAQNAQRQFGATANYNTAAANQGATNTARQYSAGLGSTAAQQAINNRLQALQGLQSSGAQGATLAGQGMGIGQGLAGQQAANGQQVQGINQSLISQAAGMFDQYTGQPLESTSAILNLLSGNPLTGAIKQTQTSTPGLKSQLGAAAGIAARV